LPEVGAPEDEPAEPVEEVAVDLDGAEPAEQRPRVAWPSPSRRAEVERRDEEPDGEADLETGPEGQVVAGEGEELDEDGNPRESRYRSRSAQLPRLGNQAKSNLTTMANLRKKSHRGD
jgi:hypothetical protein